MSARARSAPLEMRDRFDDRGTTCANSARQRNRDADCGNTRGKLLPSLELVDNRVSENSRQSIGENLSSERFPTKSRNALQRIKVGFRTNNIFHSGRAIFTPRKVRSVLQKERERERTVN